MANRYRNLIYSTAEYTHSYGGFRGVELNAASLISSPSRLAACENMYKDYDGDGADVIESVPGFRRFADYGATVHAVYYMRSPSGGEDHLLVHVEDRLMRHPVSDIYGKNRVGEQIATLKNSHSFGFEYGSYFYVMDGESILRVDEDGRCLRVGSEGAAPYVPTTYVSGVAYEPRSLLTDGFKEEVYVADPSAYLYASEGLKFTVTDPYLHYCTVSGAHGSLSGDVYLPAYVKIADTEYKVTAVGDYAFYQNQRITSVNVAHGITEIGKCAFMDCDSLLSVNIPPTVTRIDTLAFASCYSLSTFYLGAGVSVLESSVFLNSSALKEICYALSESDLERIEGYDCIGSRTVRYGETSDAITLAILASEDILTLSDVSVDGVSVEFGPVTEGGRLKGASVRFESLSAATGTKITVTGTLCPLPDDWAADMTVLGTSSPLGAIMGCTTAEVFDGRIFLSGNPAFPNTVFYTERAKPTHEGALYVGRYNYFNDGVGAHAVNSMLAVRDMLAVFKAGDDGSGSIFYHKKEATNLGAVDTVYPVAYVHSGICAVGGCLSFLDDPVFLTSEGLMALNSENINYQRNVVCRSHNVNYALLKGDLSRASLCEWLGYLVVGLGETVLLADSRAVFSHPAGSREYEWFMLRGIGTYEGDHTVYRYSAEGNSQIMPHPTLAGEVAEYTEVESAEIDGEMCYYVMEGGVAYRVEPTEERGGGVFHAAKCFISHGPLLIFATEGGQLCVFNNDMRGVAPESVSSQPCFDPSEYAAVMGNRLHPYFYSFDSHAPRYTVSTAMDDCGVPHLTKSTVKKSLVIKAKSYQPDAIKCEVRTDGADPVHVGSFPAASVGFDDFDFTRVPWYAPRYAAVALPENEKRWVEKQITLTSEVYACPISVYSLSYRYVIKGKIKNNS